MNSVRWSSAPTKPRWLGRSRQPRKPCSAKKCTFWIWGERANYLRGAVGGQSWFRQGIKIHLHQWKYVPKRKRTTHRFLKQNWQVLALTYFKNARSWPAWRWSQNGLRETCLETHAPRPRHQNWGRGWLVGKVDFMRGCSTPSGWRIWYQLRRKMNKSGFALTLGIWI